MSASSNDEGAALLFIIGLPTAAICYFFDSVLVGITAIITFGVIAISIPYLYQSYKYDNITGGVCLSIIGGIVLVGFLFFYFVKDYDDNRLSQQISRMSDMKEKLEKQLALITNTKNKYAENIARLKGEIQNEKARYGIRNLSSATKTIEYNIALIREQDAYYNKLSEIYGITRRGLEEVVFMKQRLEAVKLMDQVVSNGSDLGKEVKSIIQRYDPYSKEYAIDARYLSFKSSEEIWRQYTR